MSVARAALHRRRPVPGVLCGSPNCRARPVTAVRANGVTPHTAGIGRTNGARRLACLAGQDAGPGPGDRGVEVGAGCGVGGCAVIMKYSAEVTHECTARAALD